MGQSWCGKHKNKEDEKSEVNCKIMDDTHEKFKELLKNSRPLTEEEVQELRVKARKYAEKGGNYLEAHETK